MYEKNRISARIAYNWRTLSWVTAGESLHNILSITGSLEHPVALFLRMLVLPKGRPLPVGVDRNFEAFGVQDAHHSPLGDRAVGRIPSLEADAAHPREV